MNATPQEQKLAVMEHLVTIITDPSQPQHERFMAKRALCRIGDDRAVPLLEKALEESNDVVILADIIEILSELPTSEAVIVALIRMVWHDSAMMRREAMKALGKKGDDRVARLLDQVILESDDPRSIFEPEDGQIACQAREKIVSRLSAS